MTSINSIECFFISTEATNTNRDYHSSKKTIEKFKDFNSQKCLSQFSELAAFKNISKSKKFTGLTYKDPRFSIFCPDDIKPFLTFPQIRVDIHSNFEIKSTPSLCLIHSRTNSVEIYFQNARNHFPPITFVIPYKGFINP